MMTLFPRHWARILFSLFILATAGLQPASAADDPVKSLSELSGDLGLGGGGGGQDDILEPDQAFMLTTLAENGQLVARWIIADGHYMYRDKISITPIDADRVSTGDIQLPAGELKHDEYFGDIYVLHHEAEARLPITGIKDGGKSARFKVKYQGCSEIAGICYPPITKEISLDINPIGSAAAATQDSAAPAAQPGGKTDEPLSEQDQIAESLKSGSTWLTIISFFGFGLLLAFTPCVFPMIPILSSIIIGQGSGLTTRKAFLLSPPAWPPPHPARTCRPPSRTPGY